MTARDPHAGQPIERLGPPPGPGGAVVIMVHGRNATARSILELAPVLDRPGFTYLAPQAAGNTWYPWSFMAETERNEPYLSSALRLLERLVSDVLEAGTPRERIVLLGFSQGACLTGEFAVRNAGRYGGVVLYSGGLIGPPGTTWDLPGSFDSTPVFLGCSDIDPHIPLERLNESAAVFERMGAAVEKRIYPRMGHTVNPDEIRATQRLLDAVLAPGAA